ncbi:tetratricopeptide repeat protein [Reyranella sp.]|uniref:tetratricopeptide repeat protein n=1 Tax=Reyranella sp. TaxID=1929291 RepID=UPI003D110396
MALNDQQIQALGRDALQRAAAGDFASAEEMFARIVEARPNMGQALHLLGQFRLKLGRFAEAREPLERAAQFLPRDVSAQTNLAGCLIQLGRHEQALAALAKAARLKPDDAAISHNTGRTLEALGRTEEAERAYDLALSIDHRLLPALSARAELLVARGEWAGALADLETALVSQPNEPRIRLRRGELMLRQGDWWRGLADYEARLEIPGERYTPDLPRWQGESLEGRLLLYPEQADIESDAALRDTLMLARGVEASVQCSATLADWLDGPTVRRGESLEGFAAAAPLRSLPLLLNWTSDAPPPSARLRRTPEPSSRIGWFTAAEPPPALAGLDLVRTSDEIAACRLVVGDDIWPVHAAAALGIPTVILLPRIADWLWGPRLGISPWYASAELLRDDDREGLAARLAGC